MTIDLDYFLDPKSIAIIGASDIPGRVGYMFLENLIDCGFRGKIFPVNPRLAEVRGIKAYSHIKDIPYQLDLAIVVVRPSATPQIIRECGENGVKAVMISSAGFADGDAQSKKLGQHVVEIAREHGVHVIGPNTQGYMNLDAKLVVLSVPSPASPGDTKGVAFVSQSAFFFWDWIFRNPNLLISKAIDLGNMCDVNHADFLAYLDADPETRVIALYIEGIQDGKRFIEVAGRVAKRKSVVALKAGRTEKGADAVASHTGCLAGDDMACNAAFRQAGIIRAMDMNELNDFTKAFAILPALPKGNRVGIVTFSGAAGTLAADACGESGLELSRFSSATTEKIREILPSWAAIHNPLDLFPVLEVDVKESYKTALTAFSVDPNIDAVLLIAFTSAKMTTMNAANVFYEYAEQGPPKPTVICGLIDDEWLKKTTSLELKGIPIYPTIERAVKALAAAYSRHQFLMRNMYFNR